jgi:hypothetical protein
MEQIAYLKDFFELYISLSLDIYICMYVFLFRLTLHLSYIQSCIHFYYYYFILNSVLVVSNRPI